MIKIFNAVCLTVLCLHNQLFAGEAIRALSSFNAQLQELTAILATDVAVPSLEPRVMSAEETLAYIQQGGEIKLTAAQEQELQVVAAKERKEQVQKEEVRQVPQERKAQFLKEVTPLVQKTLMELKASNDPKDIRRWNRYLRDALETYKEHSGLQDELGTIAKSFSDIGEPERKALAEEALLRAMSYETDVPKNSKTAQAVHQFLSEQEAQELGKALGLPKEFVTRAEQVIETTKLPKELAGIVAGYDLPAFKGERIRAFHVLDLRDPEVAGAYLDDGQHAVQGLLAYSENEIVATVQDAAFDGDITIVTIPNDVSAKVTRKRMHLDDFEISGIGLLPSRSIVYVNKRGKIACVKTLGQRVDIKTAPTAIDIRGLSSVTLLPRGDELLMNSAFGIRTIQTTPNGDIVVEKLPYDKTAYVYTMALLGNGNLAYFGGEPAALKIVDFKSGRTTDLSFEEIEPVAPLAGQQLLAVPVRKKGFEVWDVSEENLRKTTKTPRFFATQSYITAIIGLPNGQIIHNGSELHALTLFDPETGKSRVLNEKSNVSVLAFDEKSGRLLVGYETGGVEIWR